MWIGGRSENETSETHSLASDYRTTLQAYLSLPECRHLIHKIRAAQLERGIKSILVLSQFSKEGKTFLTSMLANAAATLLSQRVLIVDAISNTPSDSHHHVYAGCGAPHSEHATLKTLDTIDLVCAKQLGVDEINGHSNPDTEERRKTHSNGTISDFVVTSNIFAMRERYDLVLIDGCALNEVRPNSLHPAILASHTDATVLVLSPPAINRTALRLMKELLSRYGINPLGIIVNRRSSA